MALRVMRAVLLKGFGGPEMLEYREDVPVPQAGPGEVLIRVGACGVNNTDVWTREGAYGSLDGPDQGAAGWKGEDAPMSFPRIQGADIVGAIVDMGPGVERSRLGQRVMVNLTIYGQSGDGIYDSRIIGSERDGGFAEYAAVPAECALAVDSPLSDAELASFMCSYLTAEHMLSRVGLTRGESILITGASGGVGSALVQLALLRGARPLAQVGEGKDKPLKDLGVQDFIIRGREDIARGVARICGPLNLDAAADMVAGDQVAGILEALKPHGRYVTCGAIAGPMVRLDWRVIYLKQLEILGSTLGTRSEAARVVKYVEQGKLRPLVARTYPLEQLVRAQADFKQKRFFGNLVITL